MNHGPPTKFKHNFFLIGIVGVESNWVHSALWPPIGLLCQPGWLTWWRNWWNDNWQGKPKYSPDVNPGAVVGSQRLTTWATAQPTPLTYIEWILFKEPRAACCRAEGAQLVPITTQLSYICLNQSQSGIFFFYCEKLVGNAHPALCSTVL
jgi:hypothetical protein